MKPVRLISLSSCPALSPLEVLIYSHATSFCFFWLAKFTLEIWVLGAMYSTWKIVRQWQKAMSEHLLCCIFAGKWYIWVIQFRETGPWWFAQHQTRPPSPRQSSIATFPTQGCGFLFCSAWNMMAWRFVPIFPTLGTNSPVVVLTKLRAVVTSQTGSSTSEIGPSRA